jgi:hypothetical protein
MALQHAGASYLDVRRALRDAESPLHDEDDDNEVDEERRTLGELREEITRAGGLDRWWAM